MTVLFVGGDLDGRTDIHTDSPYVQAYTTHGIVTYTRRRWLAGTTAQQRQEQHIVNMINQHRIDDDRLDVYVLDGYEAKAVTLPAESVTRYLTQFA